MRPSHIDFTGSVNWIFSSPSLLSIGLILPISCLQNEGKIEKIGEMNNSYKVRIYCNFNKLIPTFKHPHTLFTQCMKVSPKNDQLDCMFQNLTPKWTQQTKFCEGVCQSVWKYHQLVSQLKIDHNRQKCLRSVLINVSDCESIKNVFLSLRTCF